jgi:predicted acylesterase/phospholipase RssA
MAEGEQGISLCLAGGGLSGAFFEFGAVAALRTGLPGWWPERTRIVVGTSGGSMVGAVLAVGGRPEDALRIENRGDPLWRGRKDVARFLWRAYLGALGSSLVSLPDLVGRHRRDGGIDWAGVVEAVRGRFPAGFFSNQGLPELLRRLGTGTDGGDPRFEDLQLPLLVTATDLDRGERVVFGPGHSPAPSVGMAVRASTAIPVYYEPVTIGGRDLIDGQIADPMHLDLAAPPGTRMVIGVNPLIPYNPFGEGRDVLPRVRGIGAAAIMDQSGRISARIKHRRSREEFHRVHPGVELLLVEPRPGEMLDLLRAGHSPRALAGVWRLGYAAAARALEEEEARIAPVLSSLGLEIASGAVVVKAREWGVPPGI